MPSSTKTTPTKHGPADRKPPKTLGPTGRRFWSRVVAGFVLEDHHLDTLEVACLALDRAEACRTVIDREGVTTLDRWKQRRVHPACSVERDARALFLKASRELGLDVVQTAADGRR